MVPTHTENFSTLSQLELHSIIFLFWSNPYLEHPKILVHIHLSRYPWLAITRDVSNIKISADADFQLWLQIWLRLLNFDIQMIRFFSFPNNLLLSLFYFFIMMMNTLIRITVGRREFWGRWGRCGRSKRGKLKKSADRHGCSHRSFTVRGVCQY